MTSVVTLGPQGAVWHSWNSVVISLALSTGGPGTGRAETWSLLALGGVLALFLALRVWSDWHRPEGQGQRSGHSGHSWRGLTGMRSVVSACQPSGLYLALRHDDDQRGLTGMQSVVSACQPAGLNTALCSVVSSGTPTCLTGMTSVPVDEQRTKVPKAPRATQDSREEGLMLLNQSSVFLASRRV